MQNTLRSSLSQSPRKWSLILGALVAVGMPFSQPCRAQAPTAAAAPAASAASADADWDLVQQIWNASKMHPDQNYTRLHPQTTGADQPVRYKWTFLWFKTALPVTARFFDRHPEDPRRWTAVIKLNNSYLTWADALPTQAPAVIAAVDSVISPADRVAFRGQLDQWTAAMRSAPDVAPQDRFVLEVRPVRDRIMQAGAKKLPATADEWHQIAGQIQQLGEKYPQAKASGLVRTFESARAPFGSDPKPGQADLEALTKVPNPDMASEATMALNNIAIAAQPLAFTAVDGREVDLTKLKGKVVLVDFWATWCGPCKAELPNVVANYKKYHDRGFEVVGIALENAKLAEDDQPAQTERKLTAAKKVLTDFTAAHDMPWPQYFDGKYWKNDIAGRYGVASIPAMFLLDQNGTVVSTNARGPALEEQLKRLLKL